jgi:hypothetical protein
MLQRFLHSFLLLCLLVLAPITAFAAGPNWELVQDEEGIQVWGLEIPGKDLPGFRGVTVVDASIDEILNEMLDIPTHVEWMYRCRDARMLKQMTESHGILYNRVRAPWPIKDRDMVIDVDYRFTPQHNALTIRFRNTNEVDVPVPFWTVRIPRIEGFYRLWLDDAGKTNVLYQVEVDIGGNVPDGSARRYARKLPFVTLLNLRERAESSHRKK